MKQKLLLVFVLCFCFLQSGCGDNQNASSSKSVEGLAELGVYSGFSPSEIRVLPLTQINEKFHTKKTGGIAAYVSLVDAFGCQVKGPVIFRFELYEKISRSEAKGKRVIIWPDFDMREPSDNNRHWQDFLRSYKFELDCNVQKNKHYVLQVTSICPSGKRLCCELNLAAN